MRFIHSSFQLSCRCAEERFFPLRQRDFGVGRRGETEKGVPGDGRGKER